jgi:PIN domain nuclease of toxin-antitoxin system
LRLLLDTHALIWALVMPDRLSDAARDAIDHASQVIVSAASVYEVDYKRERQRAAGLGPADSILFRMPRNMPGSLPDLGYALVDISADVASRAARLPLVHKDPWDRLLVAHASQLDVPLVSVDDDLRRYDVTILW